MGIKGKTVFELTDVNTGEVEKYEDCNMITNGLQEFLDPCGSWGIYPFANDSVADFTLRILYSAAFWYLDYLRTLADLVVGTEKVLTGDVENDNLIHLLAVQKSLVYFNTAVKGDRMLLERIPKIYGKDVDMDLYEDVEIELNQADTTVGIYSDILESTMGTYSSIISNNMSAVMKRMTGLTIILTVPTFVASLYGMNVDILLTGPVAFWIIIGIAIVLTFLAFMLLRKLKWV